MQNDLDDSNTPNKIKERVYNHTPMRSPGGKKNPIKVTLKANKVMRDVGSNGKAAFYELTPASVKAFKGMKVGKWYTITHPLTGKVLEPRLVCDIRTQTGYDVLFDPDGSSGSGAEALKVGTDNKTIVYMWFHYPSLEKSGRYKKKSIEVDWMINSPFNKHGTSSPVLKIRKKGYEIRWSIDGTDPANVTKSVYEKIIAEAFEDPKVKDRPYYVSNIQPYLPAHFGYTYYGVKQNRWRVIPRRSYGGKNRTIEVWRNGVKVGEDTVDVKPIKIQGIMKYGDKETTVFPEHYGYDGKEGINKWIKVYKNEKLVYESYSNILHRSMYNI